MIMLVKMYCVQKTFVLMFLLTLICKRGEMISLKLTRMDGKKFGYNGAENSPVSVTPIQCVTMCKVSNNCQLVAYSMTQGVCHFTTWDNCEIVAGTATDVIFIVKSLPTIHVQGSFLYQFTYTTAITACEEIGGRLTTLSQLTDLLNAGFHRCACGWLDDNINAYPNGYPNGSCGNDVTIQVCGASTANAWCTVTVL